jgi:hypothetical protein
MYKTLFILFITASLVFSCKEQSKPDAITIVNKSIEVSGGDLFKHSTIDFDFRDKHYKATRNKEKFQYERTFKDSLDGIKDVLNNKGFQRFINETPFEVSKGKEIAYTASVNSVHYFSVLPYGLNGSAVNKKDLGEVSLKDKSYHKIKITFNEEGGGEDFDDVFIYWIDNETYKVDYLAYSYNENDGLGLRFREAYNERYINGIRFVDYNNYKPKNKNVGLENLDTLFEKGHLELLSKIALENIIVSF